MQSWIVDEKLQLVVCGFGVSSLSVIKEFMRRKVLSIVETQMHTKTHPDALKVAHYEILQGAFSLFRFDGLWCAMPDQMDVHL